MTVDDDTVQDYPVQDYPVQDYEVLAVRYGTREAMKSAVYLNFDVYGEPDEPVAMDYFFWLIRNDERTVLVDCGYDPVVGARRRRTTLCPPIDALEQLGIGTVDQLVVTHAHYDHIGNLRHFPDQEVVMARREFEFWTGPMGGRLQFAAAAEVSEIEYLAAAEARGQLTLAGGRHDLAPGIELIELGGHSPGQLIVTVATGGSRVVLASDAMHYYEELERDRPFHIVADLAAMYRGFDALRELEQSPNTTLVAGHDPAVMLRYPEYDGAPRGLAVLLSGPMQADPPHRGQEVYP